MKGSKNWKRKRNENSSAGRKCPGTSVMAGQREPSTGAKLVQATVGGGLGDLPPNTGGVRPYCQQSSFLPVGGQSGRGYTSVKKEPGRAQPGILARRC